MHSVQKDIYYEAKFGSRKQTIISKLHKAKQSLKEDYDIKIVSWPSRSLPNFVVTNVLQVRPTASRILNIAKANWYALIDDGMFACIKMMR